MRNISAGIPSNNTSSTSTTQPLYCKAEGIAVCSVLSLEAICIVVGNFLTLSLFSRYQRASKEELVSCHQYGFCGPHDWSAESTIIHLLLCWWCVSTVECNDRNSMAHILCCITSDFFSSLAYFCSHDILWETVRRSLATETPHTVNKSLSRRYMHSLDTSSLLFRDCQLFVLLYFTRISQLVLDLKSFYTNNHRRWVQHRYLEKSHRSKEPA